jgi:Ca2+-binding EF-hand superfamily protein
MVALLKIRGATFPKFAASMTRAFNRTEESSMRYVLLTCGMMMAASAFAADSNPSPARAPFKALDIDGDRMVSLAEAQQGAPQLASRFNELDGDKDGLLSIDEVLAGQPIRSHRITRDMQADFTAADADGDGMLTSAEAADMPIVSEFFGEMDANKDGYVTKDEIRQHARTHGPIRIVKERVVSSPEN